MNQIATISILLAGAVLAALAATLGMASTVHLTSRRSHGYMHLIFYALLFTAALSSYVVGRDFASTSIPLGQVATPERHPLMKLAQPVISLLILTFAGERIVTHWLRRDLSMRAPMLLLTTFLIFWTGTVAAPALFGANPYVAHDYVYPLVMGIAALLVSATERDMAFRAARNALLLFVLAGLLLIPFKTNLVLDTSYTQGLLPGVPRLAGLASHPVTLGLLSQLGLLCLMAFPYRQVWLNLLAWMIGLASLFLAQSKTAWIAFLLCSACIFAVQRGPAWWRRVSNPVRPESAIVSVLLFMFAVATITLALMFADLGSRWESFFDSAQGAQFASLTGRDLIWAIAYDEWQRNPLFGYGPTLWDENFRAVIGMPNATNAHNQFMDTLSRSGSVGAVALSIYALMLLVLSLRYARASHGVSLALFVAVALRSVSEVPLSLFGYGAELISHILLLMTLAVAAREAYRSPTHNTVELRHAPARPSRPVSDPLISAKVAP
jgi:O-antigen ligase